MERCILKRHLLVLLYNSKFSMRICIPKAVKGVFLGENGEKGELLMGA